MHNAQNDDTFDQFFGLIVFGVGVLLMGIGALFKRWRNND